MELYKLVLFGLFSLSFFYAFGYLFFKNTFQIIRKKSYSIASRHNPSTLLPHIFYSSKHTLEKHLIGFEVQVETPPDSIVFSLISLLFSVPFLLIPLLLNGLFKLNIFMLLLLLLFGLGFGYLRWRFIDGLIKKYLNEGLATQKEIGLKHEYSNLRVLFLVIPGAIILGFLVFLYFIYN